MSKVVHINGADHPTREEPNQEIIEHLEEALERAKSGETHGLILVEVFYDFSTAHTTEGEVTNYNAIGVTQVVLNDLVRGMGET